MENVKPAKLAYKIFEPAGGANASLSPIIFLHGVTATKEYWKDIPQVVSDATKRKAYAIDSRNHGESESTEDFTFDMNVVDLFHFMDTISVHKAILVGHSMGGITSMKTAVQKPERIEAIIIEDMFTKKIPQENIKALWEFLNLWVTSVRSIPKEVSPSEAGTFAIDILCSKLPEDSPMKVNRDQMKSLVMEFKHTQEEGYDVKFNRDVVMKGLQNLDTLMSELKGQYNGPAYFIYGGISPFSIGKEEEHIKSHFPKAELIEFGGATHMVHVEFPEKFAETVIQCLKKL